MKMKYSIIVIAGSFVLGALVLGLHLSFGLIFSEILNHFGEGKGDTAWIASLNKGIMNLPAPVVSIIAKRIGFKWASVLGSLITAAGMAASAFVSSMFYLYITYGVITGFGIGIGNFVRLTIINLYFDKRRSLAMGISTTGVGIGTVLFPLIIEQCLKQYGWRGTFLILSGFCLQGVMFGALFRSHKSDILPNKQDEKKCSNDSIEEIRNKNIKRNQETNKSQRRILTYIKQYLFLFKQPDYIMLVVSGAIMSMTLQLPFVLLPDLTIGKGITMEHSALVVTTIGISALFSRLFIGFIADRRGVNKFILLGVLAIVAGVFTIPCGHLESFPVFIGYAVTYGIYTATNEVMHPVLAVEVAGKENINHALSIIFFLKGSLKLIGMPIGGWIADLTGSYHGTFYFAGAVYLCGGIITCCIPVYTKFKTKIYKMKMDIFHVTAF